MAANTSLSTVAMYLGETRKLLQDTVSPYRYSDTDIVEALNQGLLEAYRLRPDLFLTTVNFEVQGFSTANLAEVVPLEMGYRKAFVYYMVGTIQLRDQEDTTDQRAGALLQKFVGQMLTIAS